MKILAIETSCDETAISLIETKKGPSGTVFTVLGNALASQAALHSKYGGVFPMMAKREHSKNIVPLFLQVLKEAEMANKKKKYAKKGAKFKKLLIREPELLAAFLRDVLPLERPDIDRIAVTYGPGLEPTLWVGINFAKALSKLWDIPLVPVNHMEGHILSSLLSKKSEKELSFGKMKHPALALLISGGHTELVLMKKAGAYELIGETRDDAAGEAFDKVARMLSLPYPGGPEISRLAEKGKENKKYKLPRPMLHSPDFDFSFSGLKTAVLYLLRTIKKPSLKDKRDIAKEFEDAVTEVLVEKTIRAAREFKAKTLIVGGGVSANKKIRKTFAARAAREFPNITLHLPDPSFTTDNALMIATTGFVHTTDKRKGPRSLVARGNLSLS